MQQLSLIDDLESSIKQGNSESRVQTLRRITDLFLHDAHRLNDEQIGVFDGVLCVLAEKIEKTALVELSTRLAPADTAPIKLIKRLAWDEEIAVAAPVLTGSQRLTTADLVEIAQIKGQAHLLAISVRATLEPKLTDALLVRGDQQVVKALANNGGAHFSEAGFGRLVEKADGDDTLGELVGLRKDLPGLLLPELLRRATDIVMRKILSQASPERRQDIERVIAKAGRTISRSTQELYGDAERTVAALAAAGELDESALMTFVRKRHRMELAAALARLSSTPIGIIIQLLNGHRNDAILLPCKAAQMSWPTVEFILYDKLAGQPAIDQIIALARKDYAKLTPPTAQRTLRFMTVHETVK